MEQLNANTHYQIFCGIRISSANPLTNYKLIDDIILLWASANSLTTATVYAMIRLLSMMMLGVLKCGFIQFKNANIVKLSQIIYDY